SAVVDLCERYGVAVSFGQRVLSRRSWRPAALAMLLLAASCAPLDEEAAGYEHVCGSSDELAFDTAGGEFSRCGDGDPKLPPEPSFPTDVCQTLKADKSTPDESRLDTERVQQALNACKGRAVKLVADGKNDVFITAHLDVD